MDEHPEEPERRNEIGRFLKSRRAAVSPESAGLPGGARRRTPGLRREEVAALAGLGVTWYTWFEQGRDIRLSRSALARLCSALRLDAADREYLYALAAVTLEEARTNIGEDDLKGIVDGFTAGPAIASDSIWNVIGSNRLADVVFEFDAMEGPFARNHLWRLFMDRRRRSLYVDFDRVAELAAGSLRQARGREADNQYLCALIDDLYGRSAVFRQFWDSQITTLNETIDVVLDLPHYGIARFRSARLRPAGNDGWIVVLSPADRQTSHIITSLQSAAG